MAACLINLDAVMEDANGLDPLPASVARLTSLLSTEDWGLDDIVEIVQYDPALTARLLRVSNSAAFSPEAKIKSVKRAVMHLGAKQTVSIALGSAVRSQIDQAVPVLGIKEGQLWRHSVAAALTTDLCLRFSRAPIPVESYVTALLHDIGKLLLAKHLDAAAVQPLREAYAAPGARDTMVEMELLGTHHGELGAIICRHWGLPDCIARGVLHHHDPAATQPEHYAILAYVTALGDATAETVGAALGDQKKPALEDHGDLRQILGLPDASFLALCGKVEEKLDEVMRWYE